jgi:DNA-binding transcriptional ArsR family regulator/predicted transcriptional regulator
MEKDIGYITSLIGDPVRTTILWTLLDGRAYTASELAIVADTSPQNISMHLSKLVQAELLAVESQGRHKYYRFSRPEVAYALEAIGSLIPNGKHKLIVENQDNAAIKYCRTCYDHLAGKAGVSLAERFVHQKIIALNGSTYAVTRKGEKFFSEFGIDVAELKTHRRTFAKPCLDWSERKHHLAGSLGAALLDKMLSLDWIRKTKHSRAILITSKGRRELYNTLKVSL